MEMIDFPLDPEVALFDGEPDYYPSDDDLDPVSGELVQGLRQFYSEDGLQMALNEICRQLTAERNRGAANDSSSP